MTNEIAALERRVEELTRQIRDARALLNQAKLDACPIKVGDIVIYRGAEHRVVEIDVRWNIQAPWLYGNPKKKDGTWSAVKRAMYNEWKKP